uniref:Calponin-homology (CH) domain-containing protein n=1 Tax=Oryctolagus cuniculus TaxID=9986 RepID=A0A5F9DNQ1_RABIT
MSQHRLRVPEPQGLGYKRTSSEDNLYLAVLRASEGKKGSGHPCWAGRGGAGLCCRKSRRWGWGHPDSRGLSSGDRLRWDAVCVCVGAWTRLAHGDERDRVQKKTFTKWVNKHLIKRHISDLYEDLRDGHNLISLLEVLSGDSLPREKGRMRFHKLQNVQIALDYLRHRQVKLVNIRNDDIADGNPKLTLGLIWTIILHFQVGRCPRGRPGVGRPICRVGPGHLPAGGSSVAATGWSALVWLSIMWEGPWESCWPAVSSRGHLVGWAG